jgi:uncharacterized protein
VDRVDELERRIADLGSAVVAFSGGVDSSLVAALAARALGGRSLAGGIRTSPAGTRPA